ncbi:vWA domain-containing protein [Kaistia sp. MMO-174]|uniref:vWA domain-containing protein n=1 Tax=Kaistia sp. MMO-174 TaxID=3081256 RepID=UPI003017BCFB
MTATPALLDDRPPPGGGRLDENILQFGRLLRRAGVPVGPAAIADALRAAEIVGPAARDDFYWALHATLLSRREQRPVFDEAFRQFWRSGRLRAPVFVDRPPGQASPAQAAAAARVTQAMLGDRAPEAHDDPGPERERLAVSAEERLQKRDFAQMSAAELADAEAAIGRLTLAGDRQPKHRLVSAARGRIDPRRTLRFALRNGGELILPAFRRHATALPPVVALCDISGSMSRYSRILLHFLHALGATRRVDAFLFGTRLTNVSRPLRLKDPDAALAACAAAVEDWSGGTRIAPTLRAFNRLWSRRVLGQGAIVLLVTDGLERDGGDDLAAEMERLHRASRRLIWLNPLLRFDGFEAKARGIRAMLPHVDELRAVHSLEAVADLVHALHFGPAVGAADPRRVLAVA